MANSQYEVLEFRAIIEPEWTVLLVRCSPDQDGLVGGWYKKTISKKEPALDALISAMKSQDYLFWDKTVVER